MAKRKTTRRRKSTRPSKRLCELIIIWGRNGTGKSTLAKQIMEQTPGKKLLVTRTGAAKIWHDLPIINAANSKHYEYQDEIRQVVARFRDDQPDPGKNDTFQLIYDHYRNGILMLDDCRQYITDNTNNVPGLLDILIEYRHRMLDVILVVHGPDQVPPKIWDHASAVVCMASARLVKPNRLAIDAGEDILAAQKRVNAKFRAAKARNDDSHYGIHEVIGL